MPGNLQILIEQYDLPVGKHRSLLKGILERRGYQHKDKRVPKHFNRNALTAPGGAYGYRPRASSTIKRKKKKGVDPYRPNVMTGELYNLVQSNGKVTATSNRWTWRTRGNAKRPLPDWQRRELEAYAPEEKQADMAAIEQEYVKGATDPSIRRLRRRKVSAS